MRLIDADALIARLKKDPLFRLVEQYGITGVIEAEPTIDAVPVVRCRDCIDCYQNQIFRNWYCERFGVEVQLDFYCAGAERRTDER